MLPKHSSIEEFVARERATKRFLKLKIKLPCTCNATYNFQGQPVPGEGAYSEHESEIRKNFAKFCRIFGRILQKRVDFEKC